MNTLQTPSNFYQRLTAFVRERLTLHDGDRDVFALYLLATYLVRLFPAFPILAIEGLFGTGKSTALTLTFALTHRPIILGALVTRASLYRLLGTWRTAIVDEFSAWPQSLKHFISLLLRDRWRYSASVSTAEGRHRFHGPSIIALDHPEENAALHSRMVTLRMPDNGIRPSLPTDPSVWRSEGTAIRREMADFVKANQDRIHHIFLNNELLPGAPGRVLEVWQPLAAIAAVLEDSGYAVGLITIIRSRVEEDIRQFQLRRNEIEEYIPLCWLIEFMQSAVPLEPHYYRDTDIVSFLKGKSDRFASLTPSVLGRKLRAQGLLRDSKRPRVPDGVDPASPREGWPQVTAYRFEERRLGVQS